jgi:vancomycin permeability regulator SanA
MNVRTIGMSSWLRFGLLEETGNRQHDPAWLSGAMPRGLSLFLGGFALINLVAGLHPSQFDGNLWWIDLRVLPPVLAKGFILASAGALLAYAFRPPQSRWRRWVTVLFTGLLAFAALLNAVQFYSLLTRGALKSAIPVPLSLLIAVALAAIARAAWNQPQGSPTTTDRFAMFCRIAVVCLGAAVFFPLLQMFCFGKTDYRRPADVAVVFGARVYADGRPSDALADRVRTACQLYREDMVRKLIFSGGPGDGPVTEPESMKRMAVGLGVKAEDIVLDNAGFNTQATVRNTISLLSHKHGERVLVVSHFYHLPRIKLSYQRAGEEVFTVPAKESYLLRQMPYNMAREVAALWVYYFKAVVG